MKRSKKRIHNLKRRYSLISIACICICLAIFSVLQYFYMDDIFLLSKMENMQEVALEISSLDISQKNTQAVLADMESNHNLYIEIYSPRDTLVYTTRSNDTVYDKADGEQAIELKPRIMRILSHRELENGSYFETRQEYFATAEYLVYGMVYNEDSAVELYSSTDVIKENAETASNALFAMSMFILIAIFMVTAYYSTLFTNPIRQITKTTKKIAALDFTESCPPFRIKELNELSENINLLSSKLSTALDTLKNENRQLENDIQFERKLEKTRRSFIANVSHELKTPISIIQGYAEGLKYGIGCDDKDEYCDIIIEESQKMNNLVVRIMEYMQYGSGIYEAKMSDFNIAEFLEECLVSNELLISNAKATIAFDVDCNLIGHGDRDLLRHVFINYLTNALSHLDFERRITVSANESNGCYRIKVFNTGKPIPGSDINNIWQSFYRADKAHSRSEGRFGLGLSIVATLQDLHGRQYGVQNKENGVEFWFDIAKSKK